ncbi:hypothetical protein [Acetobacter vaccinii]|uniref:UrcA family protein n=1 Tax=Acetobacter vaccinii TaxID=2592655 RepID=A0A5C1YNX4_9PROT|nr:hypothetical protein [Acetobacter vaccinii]QEO18014.1 hypothetical protein FLP30_09950 [Acetobacter vaccinii]
MMRKGFVLAVGLLVSGPALGVATPAHAAAHGWTAAACGEEPAAPTVDVSTIEHYNISVDKVSAYEKAARAYNSCVAKTAVKEETIISNDARDKIAYVHEGSTTVQKRIAGNFSRLTTALKAGGAKLQKSAQ